MRSRQVNGRQDVGSGFGFVEHVEVNARSAAIQQKLNVGGGVFTLLFLVQLYLMVWKPGL